MEKPILARYICLESHKDYKQGVMYTVEEYGTIDWGHDYRSWKIDGKGIDVTKFQRVHHNITQIRGR